MKTLINAIFVVEGKNDSDRLQKVGVPYVVSTEGLKVPRETIEHLKALSKMHTIVVLTDPDGPGAKIREKIRKEIDSIIVIDIPKNKAISKGTVGIENVPLAELKTIIYPYTKEIFVTNSDVSFVDLINLNLIGASSRKQKALIFQKLHVLPKNSKSLLMQIHLLNISRNALKEALNE